MSKDEYYKQLIEEPKKDYGIPCGYCRADAIYELREPGWYSCSSHIEQCLTELREEGEDIFIKEEGRWENRKFNQVTIIFLDNKEN